MIWFFERAGQRLHCEIRRAVDGNGLELLWTTPEGATHIERGDTEASIDERRRILEEQLKLDGWVPLGQVTTPPRFL
jgi:hypothetical protein